MKLLTKLKENLEFDPPWWSIFFHTSYFARLGLIREIKIFAPQLKGKLLDFGCGAKPYRKLFSTKEYIGVDIQKSGHNHVSSKIDVFYDGNNIPFKNSFFDSVFASEVFEHIPNLSNILSELNRVLKIGGKLLVTVPFAIHEHETPYDFTRYTSFGIKDILEKNGFRVLHIKKTNNYVESIFQLIVWYNTSIFLSKHKILTLLQIILFVTPFNITGTILSNILPNKRGYYNNLVVLAYKDSE